MLEDGVRTVVINSRYPLFLRARGDVWYQLETAAREIGKAAEPTSGAECERGSTTSCSRRCSSAPARAAAQPVASSASSRAEADHNQPRAGAAYDVRSWKAPQTESNSSIALAR